MVLITGGNSLYSLWTYQRTQELVRLSVWHLQLEKEYLLGLYQAPSDQNSPILLTLEHNLQTILKGGKITIPGDHKTIQVPQTTDPDQKKEIYRRIRIYQDLKTKESQFKRATPNSRESRKALQEMTSLLGQLDDPQEKLVLFYTDKLIQHSKQRAWLEVSTLLFLTLVGIAMTQQHRKSVRRLADSEQRFREIFRISPVGKALLSLDGKIQGVNLSLQNTLGYTQAELLEQPIRTLYGDDMSLAESKLFDRLMQKEISSYQVEKPFRHRDGHAIWVLVSVAVLYDDERKPGFIILQAHNITDLRNIQEALRISERRYRTIVESAMDGIVVADMDSTIVSANTQVNHIFGYEPEELIGKSLITLIPPIYREAHLKGMQRVRETHESRLSGKLLELQGLKKNGEIFPLELSLSTWEAGEGNMMATAIIRDTTTRKQLQRERESLILSKKSLEEFTVIASHDLQEPLRKVAFYTERLSKRESEKLEEDSRMDIQRLLTGVSRMKELIRALSEYSRITPQTPKIEPVNLNLLLQQINLELESELLQTGGVIKIDPLPVIEADEAQMEILFRNLIQNALKFHQNGVCPHIHIYGSLRQEQLQSYEAPLLEILVQDNGIGFDEKYLDRIFKVFQRLHPASSFSGTGIGLATCKKVVELHHGQITARSQPGEGSTFIISLPIYQP